MQNCQAVAARPRSTAYFLSVAKGGSGGSLWECSKMHRVVRSGGGSSPREHSILHGVDLYGSRQQVQA